MEFKESVVRVLKHVHVSIGSPYQVVNVEGLDPEVLDLFDNKDGTITLLLRVREYSPFAEPFAANQKTKSKIGLWIVSSVDGDHRFGAYEEGSKFLGQISDYLGPYVFWKAL